MHHPQIEDVAEWLAKMGRRADWMSNDMRSTVNIAEVREKWEKRLKDSKDGPKEADKLGARKHRLVALFRSGNCYSANVHANTHDLNELVNSLVRLDRLPPRNPPEGLKLLAQAWDEHRRTPKIIWRGLATVVSGMAFLGCSSKNKCQHASHLAVLLLNLRVRLVLSLCAGTTLRSTWLAVTSGLRSFSLLCSCSSLWPLLSSPRCTRRGTAGTLMIVPMAKIARVAKAHGGS